MPRNLFKYEPLLRATLGLVALILGVMNDWWWLVVIVAFPLIYTAAMHSCPMYALFGINNKLALENHFLSHLPRFNPEPVMLFNLDGTAAFQNNSAQHTMPNIRTIYDLYPDFPQDIASFASKEHSFTHEYAQNGLNYLVHFFPAPSIEKIFAYGFNVTDLVEMHHEIEETQKELIYRMGEIGETRSDETGQHVKRVAEYSHLLAKLYGLSNEEAAILKAASPMHDIGKVGIPDQILKKPAKLTEEEWKIMKTHANIGRDLLQSSKRPILQAASIVAGQHHEKFDGSGYPDGLKAEAIHIFGRITAVADVFDALGSDRVYKTAWPLDDILQFLEEQEGKHFDPALVSLLIDNIDAFVAIRKQYED